MEVTESVKRTFVDTKLNSSYSTAYDEIEAKVNSFNEALEKQKNEYLEHVLEELLSIEKELEDLTSTEDNFAKLSIDTEDKSTLKNEGDKIRRKIEMLVESIEDIEKLPKAIESGNISELLRIKDDKFEKLVFCKKGKVDNTDLPAHILLSDKCRQCKKQLKWGRCDDYSYTNCGYSDNCNSNYKYSCVDCKVKYCTQCSNPPNPEICGCERAMEYIVLYSNTCDICRTSIGHGNNGYRCKPCDFDICITCMDRLKGVSSSTS